MTMLGEKELLDLHRRLVEIPSVSKSEAGIMAWTAEFLDAMGADVETIGRNVFARCGKRDAPILFLNTHLDTVPPTSQWTRDPYAVESLDGKVFGLGSNDAKAAAAAMIAAFLGNRAFIEDSEIGLGLLLVCDEETGGEGAEWVLPQLAARGIKPASAVVGEPTGLEIVVAQKGLLVLELEAKGDVVHAAHGRAKNAKNAIYSLSRDLAALEKVWFEDDDRRLGPVTMEPTVISGGDARNMLPASAKVCLDIRTNPSPEPAKIVAFLRSLVESELRVRSDRLRPCSVSTDAAIVKAAQAANPGAPLVGSRGVSDWVHFRNCPAIKIGPGMTERSHRPDEFVLESEILAGASFYERLVRAFADEMKKETAHGAALGSH
jgi:acetylornithine deacetylase